MTLVHKPRSTILGLARSGLLAITPAWAALAGSSALAQSTGPGKIATDLGAAMAATSTPMLSWAKDINGVRHVKLLIVSNADDAELTALRAAVMAAGGSIY